MPPKQPAEPVVLDPTASMLCLILANQTDLKLDNAVLAPLLGIKDGKNVPRKVDSMIKPFGYHYEKGKVYALRGKAPKTPTGTDDDGAKDEVADEKLKPTKATVASRGKKRSSSPEKDEKVVNKKAKKAPTKTEQVKEDIKEIKDEKSWSDEEGQDEKHEKHEKGQDGEA